MERYRDCKAGHYEIFIIRNIFQPGHPAAGRIYKVIHLKIIMNIFIRNPFTAFLVFSFFIIDNKTQAQPASVQFGTISSSTDLKKETPLKWIDVNTSKETWTVKDGMMISTGKPIGVMRSEKQYENFILHVEWMHMEKGGNSGSVCVEQSGA